MGFYKYTEEDIGEKGATEILEHLEEGTRREIELTLSIMLIDYLTAIKDCESPIERMLAVGIHNAWEYWETLADDRKISISSQEEVVCGKKVYRPDFLVSAIIGGKEKLLVIECDGHNFHEKTKEQAIKDRQRERDLTKNGYIVVRFTGSEIFNNLYKCVIEIKEILFGN
jgi:very-short-patch-repair endonuclease